MKRRTLLAALALPRLAQAQAQAQAPWPNRPITVLVPNPPGGGTDFAARLVQEALARALGVQVVIDNRPGGNGNIAILATVRAAALGDRLLLKSTG